MLGHLCLRVGQVHDLGRRRARPRTFGHSEGVEALRRTVEAAGEPQLVINMLATRTRLKRNQTFLFVSMSESFLFILSLTM